MEHDRDLMHRPADAGSCPELAPGPLNTAEIRACPIMTIGRPIERQNVKNGSETPGSTGPVIPGEMSLQAVETLRGPM